MLPNGIMFQLKDRQGFDSAFPWVGHKLFLLLKVIVFSMGWYTLFFS